MPNTISIPVAEYVALNNKAMILDMITHKANGAQYSSDVEEFVNFIAPFADAAYFTGETVAAENSNDNF